MCSASDEQERALKEAQCQVAQQATLMKRSLDQGSLMDALKHASALLTELRTGSLSPKGYYELYMSVCNELRSLEISLAEEFSKGRRPVDVYELVQYAGYIVPRLYLLITVGRVFMKTVPHATRGIFIDLVEMCRGVQNPLRGLFLRNYLLQSTKDILPDTLEEAEGKTGTVKDSVEFILSNFAEMNKLWVRMQHQGHTRERERRERERQELKLLVGTNLLRLSQLESVDTDTYKLLVLPSIMEQVVSCRDPLSQYYLMDCVIQVFPDESHLVTLPALLRACAELHESVSVKTIVVSLMDRLATFATRPDGPGIPDSVQLFDVFQRQVADIIQSRAASLPSEDAVALHVSLLNLAHKCYPDRLDLIDLIYSNTAQLFSQTNEKIASHSAVGLEMQRLLSAAIDNYSDLTVLQLHHFPACLQLQDSAARRHLTMHLLDKLVQHDIPVSHHEQVDGLLTIAEVLMKDLPEAKVVTDFRDDNFVEEQELVAKFVQQFRCDDDANQQFEILAAARRHFSAGGPLRIWYTLPPLIFQTFQLAQRFHQHRDQYDDWQHKVEKIFHQCYECLTQLVRANWGELAMRLFLQAAAVAGSVPFHDSETMAYEFMSQAFTLYEDGMSDSRAQTSAIILITGTLKEMSCFCEENHEPLRTQCALHAGKLLKKPDQCRALCCCANLFWSALRQDKTELRDARRVLDCLKKAVRVSGECMDLSVQCQLLVELLNSCFFFYAAGNTEIPAEMINQLVSKLRDSLPSLDESPESLQIRQHFDNTLLHVRQTVSEQHGDECPVDFSAISCD